MAKPAEASDGKPAQGFRFLGDADLKDLKDHVNAMLGALERDTATKEDLESAAEDHPGVAAQIKLILERRFHGQNGGGGRQAAQQSQTARFGKAAGEARLRKRKKPVSCWPTPRPQRQWIT